MLERLFINHYQTAAVILSGIGLTNLLLQRNLIKKIIGLNIMNSAIFLFLAAKGNINPLPSVMALAGIVITLSLTAFALALTLKIYKDSGTLNIDEALLKKTKEQEELEAIIEQAEEEIFS